MPKLVCLCLILLGCFSFSDLLAEQNVYKNKTVPLAGPFKYSARLEKAELKPGESSAVVVEIQIPGKHHLSWQPDNGLPNLEAVNPDEALTFEKFSAGKTNGTFKNEPVFVEKSMLRLPFTVSKETRKSEIDIVVRLTFQGCQEAGMVGLVKQHDLCYQPGVADLKFKLKITQPAEVTSDSDSKATAATKTETQDSQE